MYLCSNHSYAVPYSMFCQYIVLHALKFLQQFTLHHVVYVFQRINELLLGNNNQSVLSLSCWQQRSSLHIE